MRRSITFAIRGSVHKSVGKPCARAPSHSAWSSCSSCSGRSRGFRPVRPAPRRAAAPPRFHSAYQRLTLCRLTFSSRAISARDSLPASKYREELQAARTHCCSSSRMKVRTKYSPTVVTVAMCSPHISLHARYPPHLRSMNTTPLIYPIETSCCNFKRKRAAPLEVTPCPFASLF